MRNKSEIVHVLEEDLRISGLIVKDGEQTVLCPKCSSYRRKKNVKCLSVRVSDEGGLWYCHHCGWKGRI